MRLIKELMDFAKTLFIALLWNIEDIRSKGTTCSHWSYICFGFSANMLHLKDDIIVISVERTAQVLTSKHPRRWSWVFVNDSWFVAIESEDHIIQVIVTIMCTRPVLETDKHLVAHIEGGSITWRILIILSDQPRITFIQLSFRVNSVKTCRICFFQIHTKLGAFRDIHSNTLSFHATICGEVFMTTCFYFMCSITQLLKCQILEREPVCLNTL